MVGCSRFVLPSCSRCLQLVGTALIETLDTSYGHEGIVIKRDIGQALVVTDQ